MPTLLYALAFAAGATLIIQVGLNTTLRNAVGSPVIAGLVSFVVGQLATALTVDHFGWLGFPQQPLTLVRLAGAALLFGGVLLITR
jgi:uncharacterized membrane protein YdcZ (DUF606 family)